MKKLILGLAVGIATVASCPRALADSGNKPVINKYNLSDKGIAQVVSDNGAWALVSGGSTEVVGAAQRIIDLSTNTATTVQTEAEMAADGEGSFSDVSDDGNIVAGSLKGRPAYFDRTTRKWTTLPIPSGCSGAYIASMTPDGKWACGSASYASSIMLSKGVLWNLETAQIVELANLPTLDMQHEATGQENFIGLSADGRYLLGVLSYSYLQPVGVCSYVYDVQAQTYKMLGFTESDTEAWTPAVDGLYFCEEPHISPNGKYIACRAYMVKEIAGSEWPSEYNAVALYETSTGKFTLYEDETAMGAQASGVDDEGNIYVATPYSNPLREWSVRRGNYWYSLRGILSQKYDIDFDTKTQYDNTGTPYSISADGRTIVSVVDPTGESYIIQFPQPIGEVCDGIDLLSGYTITPAEGSTFARITTVELDFDRDVAVVSGAKATLVDDTGATIKTSMSFKVSDSSAKKVIVRFRGTDLEAGRQYKVEIPAGSISLADDATRTNSAISIAYNGRDKVPVAMTLAYPADNAELARMDNSSSYVSLTFDTPLAKTDTAQATLHNKTTGELVTSLNVYVNGSQVALYPSATQYLYNGIDYQVTLKQGSVTDVAGSGPNDEITLNYKGTYVRELSHDDATLFSDDFANVSQSLATWMRYEGDHNTPTTEMQAWEFDADNQPWNFSIRDSGAADYCAASTSMYSPSGQSDDWMVVPQMEIPDEYCTLNFLAQSYKKAKEDRLKVLVWANNTNINYLTDDIMAQLKAEAEVVFDEQLSPGSDEETLAGDWTEYHVDLAKYAGKQIYIAFWNNNSDQSCLFVDSVVVKRNLKYLISLTNDESVVDQDQIAIAGRLTANSDIDTFSSLRLTLCDAGGKEIDTFSKSSLVLSKGESVDFEFANPLPLTKGETNTFTIKVLLDDYSDAVSSKVKDLTFRPTKRVVLEEFTGTTCVNCPLGILAIENLENIYGDKIIPVSIHTYDGDALGTGLSGYSYFLGLSAAPSGVVNRSGYISYPMWQNPVTFDYEFSNTATLWADLVAEEMNTPADLELSATVEFNADSTEMSIPLEVRSALNLKSQMLNVFVVVAEDGVLSYQENTFGSISDPNLGEWGKGGKYSSSMVEKFYHNDVVRSVYGSSYNGTAGFFPQALDAGETYTATLEGMALGDNIGNFDNAKAIVMLIDATTERVVNAVSVRFNPNASAISSPSQSDGCAIVPSEGYISVLSDGQTAASLYTPAGTLLDSGSSQGTLRLSTRGYRGPVVVRATAGGQTLTRKVMAR